VRWGSGAVQSQGEGQEEVHGRTVARAAGSISGKQARATGAGAVAAAVGAPGSGERRTHFDWLRGC
jgi:hypothetical protein